MDIDYKTFKADCNRIIEPVLKIYGYIYDSDRSEDYVNYYLSSDGLIEISMTENFPHVDVSWGFLTLDLKLVRPSLLEKKMKVSRELKMTFYNKFKSENDLSDYTNQMRYAVAVMEKFYKPILTGEIKLNIIINNDIT